MAMTCCMRKRIRHLIGLAIGACLLAMTGSSAGAQAGDGSFSNSTRFVPKDGEVLYRTSCQACHMAAGQGATGAGAYPALAKNAKLQAARYPVFVVVNGSRAMPPFRAQLDDEQVAAVVNYIRTHFGNDYKDLVSPGDVKEARQ
jgi:mono/diheme cytochrome c family protein